MVGSLTSADVPPPRPGGKQMNEPWQPGVSSTTFWAATNKPRLSVSFRIPGFVRKADVRQVPASAIWRLVTGWTSQVHWVPRCYSLQIFRTRFLAVSMFCFSQSLWIPLVHPLEIGNRCFFFARQNLWGIWFSWPRNMAWHRFADSFGGCFTTPLGRESSKVWLGSLRAAYYCRMTRRGWTTKLDEIGLVKPMQSTYHDWGWFIRVYTSHL